MIELRWLEKTHLPEHDGATGFTYKVLQYRQQIGVSLIQGDGGIEGMERKWSEWIDVPTQGG